MEDLPLDDTVEQILALPAMYMDELMLTLELNRIEARRQSRANPPLFHKIYAASGLVTGYMVNPFYTGNVPEPRKDFGNEEYQALVEKIRSDEILLDRLKTLLIVGRLETSLGPSYYRGSAKAFKEVDEDGMLKRYTLTPQGKQALGFL